MGYVELLFQEERAQRISFKLLQAAGAKNCAVLIRYDLCRRNEVGTLHVAIPSDLRYEMEVVVCIIYV